MTARDDWLEVPVSGSDRPALIDPADASLVDGRTWRFDRGYAKADDRRDGRRTTLYMHRLIAQVPAGFEVDHINRDRLDNRRSNLRMAKRWQNNANQSARSDNRSGYRGVSWAKARSSWQAHIRLRGRSWALGYFADPVEAAKAYDAAAVRIFGDFANPNFPREAA